MGTLLGGRLTVRLQTLDLRIGVRIPASQPLKRVLAYSPQTNPRSIGGSLCHVQTIR